MKIIITNPNKVDFKDIIQISVNIPTTLSSVNILKEYTKSRLQTNLYELPTYSYIKKGNKIVSFGKIINKDELYRKMVYKLGIKKDYLIGTNLFTIKEERGKGYAQILKQEQIKYIKKNYPKIKKLVGATTNKRLLELYQGYGAKYIGKYHAFNTVIYFYYYNI